MKRAFLPLQVLLLLWSAGVCPQDAPSKEPFRLFDRKSNSPVEITSERLTADLSRNMLTFSGAVVVRQGIQVIYADKIEAEYDGEGQIKNMHATGHVKMTGKDSFALGENLFYDAAAQTARLWGRPRLIRGSQVIMGQEMVFYVNEDRLDIKKPSIEWMPSEDKDAHDR